MFDLAYVVMCLVENVSLCLWLQTYNNEPKADLVFFFYLSPKQLFQISCQYCSVVNLLLSNLQATVLQDIVSSLRLAIYSNPETN